MGGVTLDPAVGAFLQSLQQKGLSDDQIGQLAQQQTNPTAWQTTYQGMLAANDLERQRQLKEQQDANKTQGDQKDALARLKGTLSQYGLESLADWAWSQLQSGVSEDAIIVDMHNQPAYKARFPYEDAMRKAGLPVLPPDQMLSIERDYKAAQNRNGVAPTSNPNDYTDLFVHGVSAGELDNRLASYNKLRTVYAPHIKDAFEAHAGITGVSDQDLYKLMSGQDSSLSQQYQQQTGNPLNLSFDAITNAEKQALADQQALFAQGGGETRTAPGTVESITAARQQAI